MAELKDFKSILIGKDEINNVFLGEEEIWSKNKDGYLTFRTTGSSNLILAQSDYDPHDNGPTLYYSYDKRNWIQFGIYDAVDFNSNNPVYICGDNIERGYFSKSIQNYCYFSFSGDGNISIEGDILSLYDKTLNNVKDRNSFYRLFDNCTKLTNVLLSSEIGTQSQMFNGCANLNIIFNTRLNNVLYLGTLGEGVTVKIFMGDDYCASYIPNTCTLEFMKPEKCLEFKSNGTTTVGFSTSNINTYLYFSHNNVIWYKFDYNNDITLNDGESLYIAGYYGTKEGNFVFGGTGTIEIYGCISSLVSPYNEPLETFSDGLSFSKVFINCNNLTKAPQIDYLTFRINENKYISLDSMFSGCTSLTEAPELPAMDITGTNYRKMFKGCTSLTEAPELPAMILSDNCYEEMFFGCTSLTDAPELPATALTIGCYKNMFCGCTSLTTTPTLPATTLVEACYWEMFYMCTGVTSVLSLPATTLALNCYHNMFKGCSSLTAAPELPVTTLEVGCYSGMFSDCSGLTVTPELQATTLAESCYDGMFSGCTSLTIAPTLSATTLSIRCYKKMFENCTSLTAAPALPATTLASWCYEYMFCGCTNLSTAPALPAITAEAYCYYRMFKDCTSLTTAPELPATTLDSHCYQEMFYGCTSLTTAPELNASHLYNKCYIDMFNGCTLINRLKCLCTNPSTIDVNGWLDNTANSGTFIKAQGVTWNTNIPAGWTIIDADE